MEEFFKDGMYNYHQLIHFGDDPDHVVDILPLRRGGAVQWFNVILTKLSKILNEISWGMGSLVTSYAILVLIWITIGIQEFLKEFYHCRIGPL